MTSERSRRQGHAAMLLFSVLIAGSFSIGSRIAWMVDPSALTTLRFMLAGIIVGAAAALGPGLKRAHFHAPWRYVVLGGMFAVYFVLMFEGLKTASPVSTATVFTLTPLMAAGFGWLVLRQITTPRMATALAIGGAGAVWVIFQGSMAQILAFNIGRGEAIFFVGCIAHALYVPLIARLNRGEPPLVFTFGMMIAGFLVLTIYAFRPIMATDWLALPPIFWAGMVYLTVFASSMTFFLVQYASLRLPSAKVMAYTYLTPSWVIFLEGTLGNGWASGTILLGVAAILLALFLLLKDEG